MSSPASWAATIEHVREVSLLGTAELGYWQDRLRTLGLAPVAHQGRAGVLLIAAQLSFAGIRFRELSISVFARRPGETGTDGAFLLRAYNTSRLLALCERTFFATPYFYGDVRIALPVPVAVTLGAGSQLAFRAQMIGDRQPVREGEAGWEGPVYLPSARAMSRAASAHGSGKAFWARIRGRTKSYPFLAGRDEIELRPAAGSEILAALVDSNFTPAEWAVREDAQHAKSRTYRWQAAEAIAAAPQPAAGAISG